MKKLNLGCGHKLKEGYVNIDNDPSVNPDHIVNLGVDDLPFADNTFDEVMASHILEHIGDGYISLIKELYRVCKPNAILEIFVPHHRSDWFHDDPTHLRSITTNSFNLFSKKYIEEHIRIYGSSNGLALKHNIDLELIESRVRFTNKWIKKFETMSEQDIADTIDEKNNVIEEVYIKLKAIKNE